MHNAANCAGCEKRKNLQICMWLRFEKEASVRGTLSHELGLDGALLSSLRPIHTGERLGLCIELGHEGPPMECQGIVDWSRLMKNGLYDFEVRFVDMRPEDRRRLEAFLSNSGGEAVSLAV